MEGRTNHLITIGQLAAFAGVTVKAVRHYHKRGLLAEPLRDAAGYRRYSAAHAIALVKIKTLVAAGVPLARIKDLLAADPAQFAAALAAIDGQLQERVAELQRTRARLAQLQGRGDGERLFVSAAVAAYLERLRALGVSARTVQLERDGWILLQAGAPQAAAGLIGAKQAALDDPEFAALYREYDAAFDWAADDPRLAALAERAERWLTTQPQRAAEGASGARGGGPGPDPLLVRLVGTSLGAPSPAWQRLSDRAKRRQGEG